MNTILSFFIFLSLCCVVAVLFLGLFSMMKGGAFNEKYGNKLMQARVALQALTILLLVLSFILAQN